MIAAALAKMPRAHKTHHHNLPPLGNSRTIKEISHHPRIVVPKRGATMKHPRSVSPSPMVQSPLPNLGKLPVPRIIASSKKIGRPLSSLEIGQTKYLNKPKLTIFEEEKGITADHIQLNPIKKSKSSISLLIDEEELKKRPQFRKISEFNTNSETPKRSSSELRFTHAKTSYFTKEKEQEANRINRHIEITKLKKERFYRKTIRKVMANSTTITVGMRTKLPPILDVYAGETETESETDRALNNHCPVAKSPQILVPTTANLDESPENKVQSLKQLGFLPKFLHPKCKEMNNTSQVKSNYLLAPLPTSEGFKTSKSMNEELEEGGEIWVKKLDLSTGRIGEEGGKIKIKKVINPNNLPISLRKYVKLSGLKMSNK